MPAAWYTPASNSWRMPSTSGSMVLRSSRQGSSVVSDCGVCRRRQLGCRAASSSREMAVSVSESLEVRRPLKS